MKKENLHQATRLPGIEGLRAVAALSILIYHAWLYGTPSGERVGLGLVSRLLLSNLPVGVTLFFTLSAFLLYRPIAAAILDDGGRPPLRRYARARFLRIAPAYWVVLVATGLFLGATLLRVSFEEVRIGRLTDLRILALNAGLLQNYQPESLLTGIPPAWSLAVEVVFYATLPVLGWFAATLARGRMVSGRMVAGLVPSVVLLGVGLTGKFVAQHIVLPAGGPSPGWDGDWHSVIVRSFWGHADLFAYGMALALLYASLERGFISLPGWWRWPAWTVGGGGALGAAIMADRSIFLPGSILYENLMALACACLLALVVIGGASAPSRLVHLLSWRPIVGVGLFSYSLFLWHEPLIRWLNAQGLTFDGRIGLVLNALLLAVIAGSLSAVTYRCVEIPSLRRKRPQTEQRALGAEPGQIAVVVDSRHR